MNPPEDDWQSCPQGPPQPPPEIYEVLRTEEDEAPRMDVELMALVMDRWVGRRGDGGALQGDAEASYDTVLGYSYRGGFEASLAHGQGAYSWADGVQFAGDVNRNALSGAGSYTFANGDTYVGDVLDGLRHGTGTYTRKATGEVYTGDWAYGEKTGQGKMTYAAARDGKKKPKQVSHYEGEWRGGERHGQGTMLYKSGSEYTGAWVAGKREGHGTMQWVEGGIMTARYCGLWVDGEMDGDGVYEYFRTDAHSSAQPPVAAKEAAASLGSLGKGGGGSPPPQTASTLPAPAATDLPTPSPALSAISTKADGGAPQERAAGSPSPAPGAIASPSGSGAAAAKQQRAAPAPAPPPKPVPDAGAVVINSYTGAFKGGARSGEGQFIYHDGSRYTGLWEGNAKHGAGTFFFACGTTYEGGFVHGAPAKAFPPPGSHRPSLTRHIPLHIDDILVGSLGSAKGDVDKVLDRVEALMSRHYNELHTLFQHYSTLRLDQEQRAHSRTAISMLQFWRFVKDFGLVGSGVTIAEVDRIFLKFQAPSAQEAKGFEKPAATPRPDPLPPKALSSAKSARMVSLAHTIDSAETPPAVPDKIPTPPPGPPPGTATSNATAAAATNNNAAASVRRGSVRSLKTLDRERSGGKAAADAQDAASTVRGDTAASNRRISVVTLPKSDRSAKSQTQRSVKHVDAASTDATPLRFGITPTRYHTTQNVHAADHCMYFRDFAEAIVRIAHVRYRDTVRLSLADKVGLCLEHDLNPKSQANAANPGAAAFLKASAGVQQALKQHGALLRRVFEEYSTRTFRGLPLHRARPRNDVVLTVRQFLILLRDSHIYNKASFNVRRALDLFDAPLPVAPPPTVLSPVKAYKSPSLAMVSFETAPHAPSPPPDSLGAPRSVGSGRQRDTPSPQFEGTATVGTLGSQGGSPRSNGRSSSAQWCTMSVVDATGFVDSHEADERRAQRQYALDQISRGAHDFNVHTAMTVDQELVYEEFVEALVKVAAIVCPGDAAPLSKSEQLDALVKTHLTSLQGAHTAAAGVIA